MPQIPSKSRPSRVTINEVAALAGVSKSTTSRVLGGYGVASQEARERVELAAEELGYRPNSLARAMITGKTYTLGVVLADIENDYFARLARGAGDAARAAGFEIVLVNTDEDVVTERAAIRVLLDKQVDGLVIASASGTDVAHLVNLRKHGTPFVLVDRRIPSVRVDSVGIDDRGAAEEAVGRIINAGHQRIGIITSASGDEPNSDRSNVSTGNERVAGYRSALAKAGLALDPALLRYGSYSVEAARAQTRSVLAIPNAPTALFTTDGVMALGALHGIRDAERSIPADVSLVCFDDSAWAEVVTPPLSVIRQPVYEIGRLAVERLIARIDGDTSKPRDYQLEYSWVERESVATRTSSKRKR